MWYLPYLTLLFIKIQQKRTHSNQKIRNEMQFEIGQMLPSKSDEKIYFKETIFTNTTSPTVELSNDECIKRPSLCVKSDKSEITYQKTRKCK